MTDSAEALKEYQNSDRFKEGSNPETVRAPTSQRQYLENRLYWAFRAGWKASQSTGDRK